MNRLRDEVGLDPVSERGIEILRSVRATSSSAGLKRRVWVALQSNPARVPVRLRPPLLRAVLIGCGVFAFGATAAATIGGRRMAARLERLFGRPAGIMPVRPEHVRLRTLAEEKARPAPEVVPPSTGPAERAGGVSERPTLHHRARVTPAVHAAPLSANELSLATTETALERSEVLDALVALRRDRDAARAAALLEHDLETNRHSAVRQEALVLAIEVAEARGDRRAGEGFARSYRREFPSGRFTPFVIRYLDEPGMSGPSSSLP